MILVTGAAGFVGRYVVDQLVQNGEDVLALVHGGRAVDAVYDGDSGFDESLRCRIERIDLALHRRREASSRVIGGICRIVGSFGGGIDRRYCRLVFFRGIFPMDAGIFRGGCAWKRVFRDVISGNGADFFGHAGV